MHNTENKLGNWMTAKEMALTSHNLDKDSNAWIGNYKWAWSDHFNVWCCMGEHEAPKLFPKGKSTKKLSAAKTIAAAL